ncbi:MAG: SAM-dependent methyltransferase, partial [Hymenobacteraceae bacterium]|nr:SAM-dependent methyltransferase [Hymenobacteraceae bacterium]MDX5395212.1 SAM-dependent methyltransferase [Hymenobacteraceae bacterium]MDX5442284.1 SAM-dependent methyltransferase [Hymenobacteraceae bacterium]MDX5511250.1 SAM-dependent methyltransferase [Hymenobacteraceae bacterium]
SDILYMFEQEDGSVWIDLNAAYYGKVQYQMEFQDVKTKPFDWLFIDFFTLQDHAAAKGFTCDMIVQNEHEQYLAKLMLEEHP